MFIKVNGEEVEIEDDSTIQDVIDVFNVPYTPGSIICLMKGTKEFEKNIDKYKIKTTKGSIIINLSNDDVAKPLVDFWKEKYSDFIDLNIRWTTSNEVAMGPVVSDFEPNGDTFKYFEDDVLISLSGFSKESTHIIFIKENCKNSYATPLINNGVFARVIGGKKTLDLLTQNDKITKIEPIIERSSVVDSSAVSDLSTKLEDGNQIFTYVSIDVNENSPVGVEHLYSLISEGRIKVNFESNSFLGLYSLENIDKPKEDLKARSRGSVTLRNSGAGVGRVYIYREDRVLSPNHSSIGKINKGMEIIDIARQDDFITVLSEQKPILGINISQKEASEMLEELGIEHVRIGNVDDDALIVEQSPRYTIEILKEGRLTTKGIDKENLALVELNDFAPRSIWYFKKITGLLENPIGQLKVHFSFPGMDMAIFSGDDKESKGLIPENTPENCVKAGSIGITNMSRKNVGLIGVRFEDNEEFGPTAEPFKGTNIIGNLDADFKFIEKLKEGDILYVRESMS